ncbi:MAG: multiheme c-type cytochrome [Ghiorsea sp.]
MLKPLFKVVLLLFVGLLVSAAGWQQSFQTYWDSPKASVSSHHDWSELEKNMRPEACAQCHESQFNDWKNSLHSEAYSPGLVGQFEQMGHGAGSDCLRCHAPLEQQLYSSESDMLQSLKILKKHPLGINKEADLDSVEAKLPLRHAGVSCAVCHVRQGQRFGPPRVGSEQEGLINTETHGGFVASKKFEQSNFCAECHQFPQEYAINGKPLENTVKEWQQSKFSLVGKQCQGCHMPNRKHQFKGIHDKTFTRKGLAIKTYLNKAGLPILEMQSQNIGHAFPTYVTPKVMVKATALDKKGKTIKSWQWDIVREVYYGDGWQEKRDTRLIPGETRLFVADGVPHDAKRLLFAIEVVPDQFYKGVYQSLLAGEMQPDAKTLIQRALNTADTRDYILYKKEINLSK